MVWRVDCPSGPFYALIELQSTFDRNMRQRMKVYGGLLSQDLCAQHKERELLDVLPVVGYSGRRKWSRASRGAAKWLRPFQEGKAYFLIDEELAGDARIGDVIRLVRGDALAEVTRAARALLAWPMASDSLRKEVGSIANERAEVFGSTLDCWGKVGADAGGWRPVTPRAPRPEEGFDQFGPPAKRLTLPEPMTLFVTCGSP